MSARKHQSTKRFGPTFDRCEARELLSTLPLVNAKPAPVIHSVSNQDPSRFQINLRSLPSSPNSAIHALSNEKIRGKNTSGYWNAGTSQFAIFAVQFDGALTKSNAQKAFDYGKNYVTSRKISLDTTTAAGTIRTTSNINALIGFYDVKRKDWAWIAGTYAGSRTWVTPGYSAPWYRPWEKSYPPEIHTVYKQKFITSSASFTTTIEGAKSISWGTKSGYRITTKLNPINGSGDIALTFTKPS